MKNKFIKRNVIVFPGNLVASFMMVYKPHDLKEPVSIVPYQCYL